METYVLFNPHAGGNRCAKEAELLQALYPYDLRFCDMTAIMDYAAFFASLSTEDEIILCGGDGTLNRFINNTDGLEIQNEILYYAVGTGNDFAHDLGRQSGGNPFPITEYLRNLPKVTVKRRTHRFLNGIGFGIDGYCCEVGDRLHSQSDKPVNYTAIAIKELLFHYKPTDAAVNVDGKEYHYHKVWLAPTMNGRFYGGGMMPTPMQDRRNPEHTATLMVLYGSGKLKTLTVFPSLFKGEHIRHTEMVDIHTGHDITVTFDHPTALQIDGETITNVTEYHVQTGVPANKRTMQKTVQP